MNKLSYMMTEEKFAVIKEALSDPTATTARVCRKFHVSRETVNAVRDAETLADYQPRVKNPKSKKYYGHPKVSEVTTSVVLDAHTEGESLVDSLLREQALMNEHFAAVIDHLRRAGR